MLNFYLPKKKNMKTILFDHKEYYINVSKLQKINSFFFFLFLISKMNNILIKRAKPHSIQGTKQIKKKGW